MTNVKIVFLSQSEKTDGVTRTDANSTTLSPASLTYQSSPRNTNTDTPKNEQSQTSQLCNPKSTHIIIEFSPFWGVD